MACLSLLLFGEVLFCFLLLGRTACCFCLLFGRGAGVHSLTGLPGSSLRGPTTKDQTAKTKHGFQQGMPARTVSEALSGVSGSEHEVCD